MNPSHNYLPPETLQRLSSELFVFFPSPQNRAIQCLRWFKIASHCFRILSKILHRIWRSCMVWPLFIFNHPPLAIYSVSHLLLSASTHQAPPTGWESSSLQASTPCSPKPIHLSALSLCLGFAFQNVLPGVQTQLYCPEIFSQSLSYFFSLTLTTVVTDCWLP